MNLPPHARWLVFLLILFTACSSPLVRQGAKDVEIYNKGVGLLEEGEYEDAISVFRELNTRFPSSPLVEKSLFEIARAYYLDEQDVEAEVAFDDFMRLYPDSSLIPKALLLKGKTIERSIEKAGRDQDPAVEALGVYRKLVSLYPNSPESGEARVRIRSIRGHLAYHELGIGKFYLKRKKYGAGEYRLERAIEEYGDTDAAPELIMYLGKIYLKEGKVAEAERMLGLLKEKYPDSKQRKKLEKVFAEEGKR